MSYRLFLTNLTSVSDKQFFLVFARQTRHTAAGQKESSTRFAQHGIWYALEVCSRQGAIQIHVYLPTYHTPKREHGQGADLLVGREPICGYTTKTVTCGKCVSKLQFSSLPHRITAFDWHQAILLGDLSLIHI